eukprot:1202605-Rhodomonas_salina.2
MSGTDLAYQSVLGSGTLRRERPKHYRCRRGIALRLSYAMSGTDVRVLLNASLRSGQLPAPIYGGDAPVYGVDAPNYGCISAGYGGYGAVYGCNDALYAVNTAVHRGNPAVLLPFMGNARNTAISACNAAIYGGDADVNGCKPQADVQRMGGSKLTHELPSYACAT